MVPTLLALEYDHALFWVPVVRLKVVSLLAVHASLVQTTLVMDFRRFHNAVRRGDEPVHRVTEGDVC